MGCSHTIIPASEGHLFACPGSRIGSRVRWIRGKLALGSYALFAFAFVSLFPAVAGIALLASVLNGVITLACALLLATVERWAPRIRQGQAPLFERTLQLATLLWLYAGGVFLAVSIGARL